ncbi:methyltransferase domain-containing protein, partial [Candidatus Dependentiae bacterium]|nr:methyltransferase domain-containing protein [Candidatus Dependentiae bacterium]
SISLLSKVPFIYNSDGFHFDTEIIIQAAKTNSIIEEASIPTFYGDEKCHVNGIKYALNCIRAVIQYHLVNIGLYYQKNFDFGVFENDNYYMKKSKYSLHQFILNNSGLNAQTISIELGANKGLISSCFAELSEKHYAVDNISPKNAGKSICYALNLNNNFSQKIENSGNFDVCFSLDIIEHLDSPENFLNEIFNLLKQKGTLFISTANISYFPMRISLLSGQFNYSKRGILDLTHKRLFTINGFKKLLNQQGFRVIKIKGFGPPITDLISKNKFFRLLEKIHYYFSNFFPSIFAYNYLIIAQRMDSISEIFDKTISSGKNKNL